VDGGKQKSHMIKLDDFFSLFFSSSKTNLNSRKKNDHHLNTKFLCADFQLIFSRLLEAGHGREQKTNYI
jgi:hypothetical protein